MHVTSNRNHPIVWSVSYSVVPKFTSRGVEHRIRNLSQDIPRMCRDRASKLRFFKFFASNENERCLVHRPSIVPRYKWGMGNFWLYFKFFDLQNSFTFFFRGLTTFDISVFHDCFTPQGLHSLYPRIFSRTQTIFRQ